MVSKIFSIQLSSNYVFSDSAFCKPFKSNEISHRMDQTLKFISVSPLLMTPQPGQAILSLVLPWGFEDTCCFWPSSLLKPLSSYCPQSRYDELKLSDTYIHPLAYKIHKERRVPSSSLLCFLSLDQSRWQSVDISWMNEWLKATPYTYLKNLLSVQRNTVAKYCPVLQMRMKIYQLQDLGLGIQHLCASLFSFGK